MASAGTASEPADADYDPENAVFQEEAVRQLLRDGPDPFQCARHSLSVNSALVNSWCVAGSRGRQRARACCRGPFCGKPRWHLSVRWALRPLLSAHFCRCCCFVPKRRVWTPGNAHSVSRLLLRAERRRPVPLRPRRVRQRSPACCAASTAGAWNALMLGSRSAAGALRTWTFNYISLFILRIVIV